MTDVSKERTRRAQEMDEFECRMCHKVLPISTLPMSRRVRSDYLCTNCRTKSRNMRNRAKRIRDREKQYKEFSSMMKSENSKSESQGGRRKFFLSAEGMTLLEN